MRDGFHELDHLTVRLAARTDFVVRAPTQREQVVLVTE